MNGEHPSGRGRNRLCREVAAVLPAFVDEPKVLDGLGGGAGEQHLRECLRCQADVARYRRLRRTMRGLSEVGDLADPVSGSGPGRAMADALGALESALDEALGRRERRRIAGRKTALLGGIAAATAAGVGGVLVLATRRRSA
jgi:anti-sigma factor RsiW